MPPLTAIERFFERLFERPSARLFRARIQPVQLQRRIERAMEGERLTTSDRTLVPNRFVVHLHPTDLAEFGDMTGTLASELADGALSFARAHRYTVVDRPRVDLLADPTIERTDIRVDARFAEAIAGRSGHGPVASPRRSATPATEEPDPTATRVYAIPRPRNAAGGPARHRSGRPDPRGRRRGRQPDHRPGDRQRPRRARRAGLAPSRPDRRSARDAGLRGPRQHERIARQRRAR